jgi:hypothetical protein
MPDGAGIAGHEILQSEAAALAGPVRGNPEGVLESHEASALVRAVFYPRNWSFSR